MIFRLFYKLSFLGRFTADVVLAVFFIFLLFPILPATGMINHPSGSTTFIPKYFIALVSKPIINDIIFAAIISFVIALLLIILGLTAAYFCYKSFTGKFALLGLVSFFLLIPDSISFLLGVPFLAIFSKKNLYFLTYASCFSWGFAAALLGASSFLYGIRKSEIQTLHMLGGNHIQILTTYIFPRAIPFILYGSFSLGCILSLQGLYTFQQASGRKSLLHYHLTRPQEFFNDPGPGGAVYLVLFCLAIIGAMLATRYSSVEIKLAKALNKVGYTKTVRRRKPKLKSKKKQTKVKTEKATAKQKDVKKEAETKEIVDPEKNHVKDSK